MKKYSKVIINLFYLMIIFIMFAFFINEIAAQPINGLNNLSDEQKKLLNEHVYGGLPSSKPILIRHAYILCYDADKRIPEWVAYHITPDYLKKPPREGKFASFRKDQEVENAVTTNEYIGLKDSLGYVRGHLVPYGVAGGDRDGDGKYAIKDLDGDGEFTKNDTLDGKFIDDDDYEIETIKQINYMSNIAPQHHDAFNGSGGLWFNLERWIQDSLVRKNNVDMWVFAGSILGAGEIEKVGSNKDISVPAMFYKIVIKKPVTGEQIPKVLAFLFPHQREKHGDIEDFLVSVDIIEALTGLNFFNSLEEDTEDRLEKTDTWIYWEEF